MPEALYLLKAYGAKIAIPFCMTFLPNPDSFGNQDQAGSTEMRDTLCRDSSSALRVAFQHYHLPWTVQERGTTPVLLALLALTNNKNREHVQCFPQSQVKTRENDWNWGRI